MTAFSAVHEDLYGEDVALHGMIANDCYSRKQFLEVDRHLRLPTIGHRYGTLSPWPALLEDN
jgi:hypothetical protein